MSNSVSRRQAGRWAEEDQQQDGSQQYEQQQAAQPAYAAPPPVAPADDMTSKLDQLQQLGALRDQGVLSDAEFETQKSRILNS